MELYGVPERKDNADCWKSAREGFWLCDRAGVFVRGERTPFDEDFALVFTFGGS